jgi:flagellin
MGIRITGGEDSGGLRALQNSSREIQDSTSQLSSGLRLNRAADDAAALAIASRLESEARGLQQAQRNVQTGVSIIQTADAGLDNIQEDVQRIRELAVQASNGTLSDDDRQAIQAEIDQRVASIDQAATNTEFNGQALLEGSAEGAAALQIAGGADGTETLDIDIADSRAAALGLDTIDVTTQAGAEVAVTAADTATEQISETRAEIGATQNRLQSQNNRLATTQVNAEAARSRIRDSDIAEAVTQRTAAAIRNQFATAVQVQTNQNRGSVLQLLNE